MKKLPLTLLLSTLAALACTPSVENDDGTMGSPIEEAPAPAGLCDPSAIRDQIVANYAFVGTATEHRARRFADLGIVYDADNNGTLDAAEQQAIVDDFTAGCAVIQAKLLATWDADKDGTLSDSELQTAQDAFEAAHGHHGKGDGQGMGHDDHGNGKGMGHGKGHGHDGDEATASASVK